MATQLIVSRELSRLVPVTGHDLELLSEIPMGREMMATLTMPRSLKQNRFYWKLLETVVANHPFYKSATALHLWIKVRLGYVTEIYFHDGEIHNKVDSTAFDKMDGLAMRQFIDAALSAIVEEVLPGVRRLDLLAEAERMLGMKYETVFPKPAGK